jgi:hypothetical protein
MKNNPGLAPVGGCWKYGKFGPYATPAELHEKRFYLHFLIYPLPLVVKLCTQIIFFGAVASFKNSLGQKHA